MANKINPMSKFEATMYACQNARKKALAENTISKKRRNALTKNKKAIQRTNRITESTLKRRKRMIEEEEYDPEIDDELPADTATDAVIVIDPELDTDEYESNLDDLQAIIDETPDGETPSVDEYIDDLVYTCPICGNNFFSEVEMGSDEDCPVCGETADDFILVGNIASPDEDLDDEGYEDDDFDDEDLDIDDEELEEELETDDIDFSENRKRKTKRESYKYLLDEKSVDPFLTKFITENYKNASSMRVVGAKINGRVLKLECVIKFKSGTTKKSTITIENFRPSVRPVSLVGKADSAFKVKSKKTAPFTFEAYTKNNVIRVTGMKYDFITKKEGKTIQVYGKYALKESAKSNFQRGRR